MFSTETIPTYMMAKGGCYVCSSQDRLVSTGVQIEGEGILCICAAHLHDMLVEAGWHMMSPVELDEQKRVLREYQVEVAKWHERAKLAETRLAEYEGAVRAVLTPTHFDVPDVPEVKAPKNLVDPVSGKFVKR